MRVRHLQSHLQEQQLVNQGQLIALNGSRIGVDAVYWLRSIQALKDPFADALGGVPPGMFGFVNKELEFFKRHNICPVFVFQGMAPGPQHSMFVSRMDSQMDLAWTHLSRGNKSEAQKCFAISTSRINGDFVYFIFHHLKGLDYEVVQAPYFAGAQLAHFCDQNIVSMVFGPPGLMLYNIQRVVIMLDFQHSTFECVDLPAVLNKWHIDKDQFVDACMLAGTEYCLTYPYLNLGPFQETMSARFNFDAAVYIIKQAPLINWMQTFPTQEMKNDHVDGYCTCKVLVQSSPILHLVDNVVRPLDSSVPNAGGNQVPSDFHVLMGEKLPNSVYFLMLQGVLWHKLPQALATGEWLDKSQPLVDTKEFRDLVGDLVDYRELSLGLIARHLPASFMKKAIVCKNAWDLSRHSNDHNPQVSRTIHPKKIKKGLRWRIHAEALSAEMSRQKVEKVDLKFCLQWHAFEFEREGPLYKDLTKFGDSMFAGHRNCLSALVHFMLLEHLELIADDGGMTVLGNVLKDTPRGLQEPCLIALEMMKFGVLNGEPFDAGRSDKPFPAEVNYPKSRNVDVRTKSVLLLSRVFSLVPMRLRADMWNADVVFDLAAFHTLVRVLKRALRQLTEASLSSVLLRDLSKAKLLPPGFMSASSKPCARYLLTESSQGGDPRDMQSSALLPPFMPPRACMGIVCLFFLSYQGDPTFFQRDLQRRFPCCQYGVEDLTHAMIFWEDLRRCVDEIAEPLGAEELAQDMKAASILLADQQSYLGIFPNRHTMPM